MVIKRQYLEYHRCATRLLRSELPSEVASLQLEGASRIRIHLLITNTSHLSFCTNWNKQFNNQTKLSLPKHYSELDISCSDCVLLQTVQFPSFSFKCTYSIPVICLSWYVILNLNIITIWTGHCMGSRARIRSQFISLVIFFT